MRTDTPQARECICSADLLTVASLASDINTLSRKCDVSSKEKVLPEIKKQITRFKNFLDEYERECAGHPGAFYSLPIDV